MLLLSLAVTVALSASEPTLPVVYSAARRVQPVNESVLSVTVIERAQIERSQAQDAPELLRKLAGVDISRTGGPGSATSVFLRGSNSNHVLVLIDGVRVASSNTGAYAFEQLPVELIERIEIVRGPAAAVWGSDAIGGVIHVFTRAPDRAAAQLSGGTYSSWRASGSYGVRDERGGIGLSVSRRGTRGFSSQNPSGFSYDPDLDSNYSERALIAGDLAVSEQTSLKINALRTSTDVEFDQGRSALLDRSVALVGGYEASERYRQELRFGYASQDLNTPAFGAQFASRRLQADWQHQFTLPDATELAFGLNVQNEEGESRSGSELSYSDERDLYAGYVSYGQGFGAHRLEISGRFDDDSTFGGHGSGAVGWSLAISQQGRINAHFGQGFRAPNFNELYSPGFDGLFAGNPGLEPEVSRSGELGYAHELSAAQRVDVRVYRTQVRDLISFSGGQTFRAENIARARLEGVELRWSYQAGPWHAASELTLQDPENLDTGRSLLRRAKRKLGGRVDYDWQALSLGADLLLASPRQDFAGTLPGYGIVGLRASVPLSEQWHVDAKVENLLDKEYELAGGFNTSGRAFTLTLRWQ